MKKEVAQDVSKTPLAAQSLIVMHQQNGVIRIHGDNGGYLFSIVRAADGKVYQFQDGFGTKTQAVEIKYL